LNPKARLNAYRITLEGIRLARLSGRHPEITTEDRIELSRIADQLEAAVKALEETAAAIR
jgi:hypothetical protein